MSRLIVNADDFGLTAGVNRAIRELYCAGALTSTTLMARGAAAEEAIEMARTTPALGVGCHVVLVDGEPVLPPQAIPTLIDRSTGRLLPTLGAFLQRLLTGRINADEVEAETAAQIALLQSKGVALTHIDTHKHVHMFPEVLRPVLRAARAAGVGSVRNPFEPEWSLRATRDAAWVRRMEVKLLRWFEPTFRRTVAREGLATTDGAIGVLATGTLDAETITHLMEKLPEGCWELVTHPGVNDADLALAHTRLRESREIEREALHVLERFAGIERISFAALPSARPEQ